MRMLEKPMLAEVRARFIRELLAGGAGTLETIMKADDGGARKLVVHFAVEAPRADGPRFRRPFSRRTLQRKLKHAERVVVAKQLRKDPGFHWIPTTIGYVRDALAAAPAELPALREAWRRYAPELTGLASSKLFGQRRI